MSSARLTIAAYRVRESRSREREGSPTVSVIDTQKKATVPLTNVSLSVPGTYVIEVLFEPLDAETPTSKSSGGHGFTGEMAAQVRRAAKDTLDTDPTSKRFNELETIANLIDSLAKP